MKMNCKSLFSAIYDEIEKRNAAIAEALTDYRSTTEYARSTFKDDVATARTTAARNEALEAIRSADTAAKERADALIADLRTLVRAHVIAMPDKAFMERLALYQSFGREISRMEIEALAGAANGCYAALACVEKLANESGFSMAFPGPADYENDLTEIERLFTAPSCWAPEGYITEALELLPGTHAFQIAAAERKAEQTGPLLEEIADRWQNIRYTLTEDGETAPLSTEDGETAKAPDIVKDTPDTAGTYAAAVAQDAAANRQARETVGYYKTGKTV